MKLNENYRVVATDNLNITLQRRSKRSEEKGGGFTEWVNVGYYSDFKTALKSFIKKEILGEGLEDYKSICIKIDDLYKLIDNLDVRGGVPNEKEEN